MHRMPALVLGLTVLASLGAATATSQAGQASDHPLRQSITNSSHLSVSLRETSAANSLADEINTIGESKFVDTYVGILPTSQNSLVVYVTYHNANFTHRIATLPHQNVTVTYKAARYSYHQLEALTMKIAHNTAGLARAGINLQSWAPDTTSDTVKVTLSKSVHPEKAADYVASARRILEREFGTQMITVVNNLSGQARAVTRDHDTAPFNAGNGIFLSGFSATCSEGWAGVGKASGSTYILAAGHCGTGHVYVVGTSASLGSVSKQYLDALNSDELDFETIGPSSALPHVWYGPDGSISNYIVTGATVPAVGSEMTMDGDEDGGQITGNTVVMANGCVSVTSEQYGSYHVCHAGEATDNSSGPKICIPGDSGGPGYVRLTNPDVNAAGTIVAINNQGHECYFQEVEEELSAANLRLKTS